MHPRSRATTYMGNKKQHGKEVFTNKKFSSLRHIEPQFVLYYSRFLACFRHDIDGLSLSLAIC